MSERLGSGDFRRLAVGSVTITEDTSISNPRIGEPFKLSQQEYDSMLRPRRETMSATPPMLTKFQDLQTQRDQRDQALWDDLWTAIDPKLRARAQETARDLSDAEQALAGARAQLADLDSRQPSKAADVPKWAAKRGEVAGMINAFETLVYGARQAYTQASQAAQTVALGIVTTRWKQAEAAHNESVIEYQRQKEAARQYLADANEARDAVRRLYAKTTDANFDLFR